MTDKKKTPETLRSARWFAPDDLRAFGHRSRAMQMGYAPEEWKDRPVIAILNTWSDAQPCHMHFKSRVDDVKRGVLMAGGFPLELPALSLSESLLKPTTMLYRNLLAMDAEELLRGHPVDGVVLMGGCDKTTPALLLGATSMNLPAIYLPAGPMLRGNWKGRTLGSGSDAWKYWDERRAGKISDKDWVDVEAGIARSYGTCMTMGTASTMTAIAESIGMTLPGASSIPAADAAHIRMSSESGRRIVEMVWEDLTPQKIQTRKAFENAITVAMAMGCSTNAIIHLIAQARRAGQDIGLDDFEIASRKVPVIANVRPSGDKYLMEDFFYAGGLPGLMSRIRNHLHLDCATVTGKTLGENIASAEVYNDDVIRTVANPIYAEGALAVLKGNLAPDGCVIKPSACEPRFLKHTGPALVFDDYPSMKKAIDDPDLDVTADHVLILRNAGPQGGPGMPEWGMLPIPTKLVKQGVRDMVRLSDARMSGTSYGACILHVSPESFIGGPLALVKNGDRIRLDVAARSINLDVPEVELAKRRAEWKQPETRFERGYGWMFTRHIKQANEGCDFDFLETVLARQSMSRRFISSSRHSGMVRRTRPGNLEIPGSRFARPGMTATGVKHMIKLSDATRNKLKTVSTATVATALFKRGFRIQTIQDVHPLSADQPTLVGEAFTLRYMPAREDLNKLEVFRDRSHPQRKAIEDCPPGAVLVMDSRKDARAASAGAILVTRLMQRGVAGVVTDGGFRDSAEIAKLGFPAYHHRPSAPTNLTLHQAIEINVPIGCGDAPVFPGDVILGDSDGVIVIPAHLADEIANEAFEMTAFEDFVTEQVRNGRSIFGLYPATDAQTLADFAAWRKKMGR
jgi:dihydroxy-acid dehydratase